MPPGHFSQLDQCIDVSAGFIPSLRASLPFLLHSEIVGGLNLEVPSECSTKLRFRDHLFIRDELDCGLRFDLCLQFNSKAANGSDKVTHDGSPIPGTSTRVEGARIDRMAAHDCAPSTLTLCQLPVRGSAGR